MHPPNWKLLQHNYFIMVNIIEVFFCIKKLMVIASNSRGTKLRPTACYLKAPKCNGLYRNKYKNFTCQAARNALMILYDFLQCITDKSANDSLQWVAARLK